MPRIYRSMREKDGHPETGESASHLGVRVPAGPGGAAAPDRVDIHPDAQGFVAPGEGMSVAPDWTKLPLHRVPMRFLASVPGARGSDRLRVWTHGEGPFIRSMVAQGLRLRPDREDHGVVEPAARVQLRVYVEDLHRTASSWTLIDEEDR